MCISIIYILYVDMYWVWPGQSEWSEIVATGLYLNYCGIRCTYVRMYCIQSLLHVTPCGASAVSYISDSFMCQAQSFLGHSAFTRFIDYNNVFGVILLWKMFFKLPLSKSFLVFSCCQKVPMLLHLVAISRQCLQLPAYRVCPLTLAGSFQGTVTAPFIFRIKASCADSNWQPTQSDTECAVQWLLC